MNDFRPELIAMCGMDCNICSSHLAYSRNIPKKRGKIVHCKGCRPRDKMCVFLKGKCPYYKEVQFCFECPDFPCESLKKLDQRYRTRYDMSMIENIKEIKSKGLDEFLKNQREKYRCPNCGGVVSVHNKRCYDCEEITSWRE